MPTHQQVIVAVFPYPDYSVLYSLFLLGVFNYIFSIPASLLSLKKEGGREEGEGGREEVREGVGGRGGVVRRAGEGR